MTVYDAIVLRLSENRTRREALWRGSGECRATRWTWGRVAQTTEKLRRNRAPTHGVGHDLQESWVPQLVTTPLTSTTQCEH